MYGWAGTVLNVDLTEGRIEKEPLDPDFARKYLGASGFNSIKLFESVKPETDSLSPDNVIMFGAGPLSGTIFPGSNRLTITALSPWTEIFGDSNSGGFFAPELKFAGYDQIVVRGKAQKPVYLWIENDEVELRDASHLWGRSTWETGDLIREELADPDIQVICIGQAGENLVRFASVIYPKVGRAFGRCGMGTVMGSKNLKAIAVRGTKGVAVARTDEFLEVCREVREHVIKTNAMYPWLHDYGTSGLTDVIAPSGAIGVRNYQNNLFPNWKAISGETLKKEFGIAMKACTACFVACKPYYRVTSGEFAGIDSGGIEFALTGSGFRWGIDNLPALLKMYDLFNQYGLDIHGTRNLVAWAMECYQRGILTKEDFDGTPLSFGDYNSVLEMIPKIAKREGFGNILAEGDKRVAELVGRGSEKYLYHIKGASFVPEDPRTDKILGFAALTSSRGACHLKSSCYNMWFFLMDSDIGKELAKDPEILDMRSAKGTGMAVKWFEDAAAIHHASGACVFVTGGSPRLLARALSSATGVDFSAEELLEIGERIYNLDKAFNSRLGLTREDDNYSVPDKFIKEPIKEGAFKGQLLERDIMLDDYYKTRGWDLQTGLQTREKLEGLGLKDIADELEKSNAIR